MKMQTEQAIQWLNTFAKEIIAQKEKLNELDTAIGDGDHGSNMVRGVNAYSEAIKKSQPQSILDVWNIFAMALIAHVGGTSGPLYGSAFLAMRKKAEALQEITTAQQLGELVEAGAQAIQKRGRAEVKDKTMLDVWYPVVAMLKKDALTGKGIQEAFERTRNLRAKKGRASYLGERSIGHLDPGAASSLLLFQSLLTVLKK